MEKKGRGASDGSGLPMKAQLERLSLTHTYTYTKGRDS